MSQQAIYKKWQPLPTKNLVSSIPDKKGKKPVSNKKIAINDLVKITWTLFEDVKQ